jgi:predicted MPP superfamily phosphohydrolase
MNILHLTDFHFRAQGKYAFAQDSLIEDLCKSLKDEPQIDLVFFTGDLVNKGDNKDDFNSAKLLIIQKLNDILGIDSSQIFFCAGNHDVFRNQEMEAISLKFETIISNDLLDEFVNGPEREFEESIRNHEHFIGFQKEFYSGLKEDEIHPLYSIHKRIIENKKIGIVSINSAWRSINSIKDRGNLYYPITLLRHCITNIKDCELKILLLHHPLSDFKDWNCSQLEDIIFHEFQLMFSGHIHRKKQSMQITSDEGIFCCTSPATLSLFENESKNGHTILNLNVDSLEISIINFIYDKTDRTYYKSKAIPASIPLNTLKIEQNEFRKTLRKRVKDEIDHANDLFITSAENLTSGSFLQIFSNPILKYTTKTESQSKIKLSETMSLESIITDNLSYVIFGKDKSGKTSLLTKINLELLQNFSNNKTLTLYVDCKQLKSSQKPIDFISLLSKYYEVNKQKIHDILSQYHMRLLIDNYDPGNEILNNYFTTFLQTYKNVSFIATMEETLSRLYENLTIGPQNHTYLFIHEISRTQIRELTNKWPNLSSEKREYILEKIGQIFIQLNIPLNYWTVSLFIWVYEKNADANFHNNVDLIQLYVDGILDRNRIAFDKNTKINFEDFKIFISELSYYLINEHGAETYSADYTELINFTNDYREKNKKFVIGVEEIVDMLIIKGILKKRHNDGRYTFRLNGVFEYFLAYYMKDNAKFRDKVIQDNHYYLSFGNELELCSGFTRRDESLLNSIYLKTKALYNDVNKKYLANGNSDKNLLLMIQQTFDISASLVSLNKDFKNLALPPEKQDKLVDQFTPLEIQQVEVARKKYYEAIESNPENLEKALFILARVFRNSTLSNDKLNNDVIDFILNSACNLGFTLIEDTKNVDEKFFDSEEDEQTLMKLVTNFIPLIVQTFLYDALAQNNLERIILEKIEVLKKGKENNQFQLLLLYFLLIDLNVKQNKNYIDNLLGDIHMPILRQTILVKLYTYLMFKSHNSESFQEFLGIRIQNITYQLNPNSDKSEVQKKLAKKKTQGKFKSYE